jgi:hypothetical protein
MPPRIFGLSAPLPEPLGATLIGHVIMISTQRQRRRELAPNVPEDFFAVAMHFSSVCVHAQKPGLQFEAEIIGRVTHRKMV